MLPPDLLDIYRHAIYRVFANPVFTLQIGKPSAGLLGLYREQGTLGAAFITACNPRSHPLLPEQNTLRQHTLETVLTQQGWFWIRGQGEPSRPDTDWPPETSCLVLGISREEAAALGRRFEQNAIVFCNQNAVPELMVLA